MDKKQPEAQQATCTNSDSWNCKYCNKTKTCAALAAGQATAAQAGAPANMRLCYSCGHPADAHPWMNDPRGGKRRGDCPAAPSQPAAQQAHYEEQPDGTTIPIDPSEMAPQQGAAYAALPEYGINTASHAHFRVLGFTADQLRAFADATHALRASHGQAPAQLAQRFDAADVATASAQGFRDGAASVSAGSEPVAWQYRSVRDKGLWFDCTEERAQQRAAHPDKWDVRYLYTHPYPTEGMAGWRPTSEMRAVVAVAVTMLYYTHPEDVLRVFDLCELEKISIITMLLGSQQVEDIYRSAWDHLTAPPAQPDSVQEDAARYRLLRRGRHLSVVDGIGNDLLRADALDAAVDAARKQGATP